MAYRIVNGEMPEGPLTDHGPLSVYDTLEEPHEDWYMDWDETLHERSVLELVRDRLTEDQRAELDRVDAYWRAHPAAFNERCKVYHHQKRPDRELAGRVVDDEGHTPRIPLAHWWWWPLDTDD